MKTGPGTGRLSFSSILKLTPRPESPRQNIRSRRRFWMALLAVTVLAGCAHQTQQMRVVPVGELEAICVPPAGWTIDRAEQTSRYVQRVWVSPTGKTSYGVIRFTLPLPVGQDIALLGFLSQMKRSEGDARLITKRRDPEHGDRLDFIAEGGRYHVDGIIVTRGRRGWAVYAGSLRHGPPALDELELAVQARENTTLGPVD